MLRNVSVVLAPATLALFVGSTVLTEPVFPKERSSPSAVATQPEAKRPLPSGRAAGIKQAQAQTNGIWNWVPFAWSVGAMTTIPRLRPGVTDAIRPSRHSVVTANRVLSRPLA
jgi:hypothetical protein